MGRCGGFHACAAALHRGDGDGADAAAVLWAGSSKKASLTDVARALDVRSTGYKSKYYINRPRILMPRQIEVQRKVEVEGGGVKSAKPVT